MEMSLFPIYMNHNFWDIFSPLQLRNIVRAFVTEQILIKA